MLLTRSPLSPRMQAPLDPVRLACVKHAASVHPEPGSNSPTKTKNKPTKKQQAKKRSNQKSQTKMVQARKQSSKNKHQQSKNKTFQNHQHQKTKNRKNQNTQPNSQAPQSIPHKQNKKTHYREHKQPNHKPTKLAGQDSLRAKNNRRKTCFPPASSLSNEYKVTAPTPTGQTRLAKSKRHHNSSDSQAILHSRIVKVPRFSGQLSCSNPNRR